LLRRSASRNDRDLARLAAGRAIIRAAGIICVVCVICGFICLPDRTASFARWQMKLFLGIAMATWHEKASRVAYFLPRADAIGCRRGGRGGMRCAFPPYFVPPNISRTTRGQRAAA
jgi:hypothetical protein